MVSNSVGLHGDNPFSRLQYESRFPSSGFACEVLAGSQPQNRYSDAIKRWMIVGNNSMIALARRRLVEESHLYFLSQELQSSFAHDVQRLCMCDGYF